MSVWLLCRRQNSPHGGTSFGFVLICFAGWLLILVIFSSGLHRMIFGGETRILSESSDNTLQTLIPTIHHPLHIRPYLAPYWKASSHNGACLIESQNEATSSTMDF